ncbi:MAG: hypothetical protein KA785_00500 [Spirochaetaceae bacterium]|nr:hypothetical protein [Spirochaetaceae bacterium]
MKINFMMLFCFLCVCLYSENIYSGKKYSEKDIVKIVGLKSIIKISIEDRYLEILGQIEKNGNGFLEYKLVVLRTKDGSFLDSMGIILYDNQYSDSTLVTDNSICIKTKSDENPIYRLLYVQSISNSIVLYPIKDKFIADICVGENSILYTTEMDNNTIRKININSGEVTDIIGYYPNVEIFKTFENGEEKFWFVYNDKTYVIEENTVKLSNDIFERQSKIKIIDLIIGETKKLKD